ncbi:MAG TPA: hypothetical protein VKH41_05235 [Myxococcota bacterium]|nr:hypothetical protein [Myxococcota bacterium]
MAQTTAVSERGRLVIDAWAGRVSVSAGRGDSVEVALRGWGVLPAPAIEIERSGNDVYVEARSAPQLQWLPLWVWSQVQIEVCVPARYSVDVATAGGRVEVHGFDGDVAVRSV